MGLASLGQVIIKRVAIKKYSLLSQLEILISKFDISCPNEQELIKIIKQKNRLVSILNQLKRNIIKIDNTTRPLKPLIKSLSIASKALKIAPLPVAFGSPAVALPLGLITTAGDALSIIKAKITSINSSLMAFTEIKNYIIRTVDEILAKIAELDKLIIKCAPPSLAQELNTQPSLNNSSLGDDITDPLLDDNQQNETYDGFSFDILIDTSNESKFIRRYAIAKNKSGVIMLRGESSYSSSTKVLIDELKFIIDRDNLKAF